MAETTFLSNTFSDTWQRTFQHFSKFSVSTSHARSKLVEICLYFCWKAELSK
jgi:hypothetical protein